MKMFLVMMNNNFILNFYEFLIQDDKLPLFWLILAILFIEGIIITIVLRRPKNKFNNILIILGAVIFLSTIVVMLIGQKEHNTKIYNKAMEYYEKGDYETTKEMLQPLAGLKDVDTILTQCNEKLKEELDSLRKFKKEYEEKINGSNDDVYYS